MLSTKHLLLTWLAVDIVMCSILVKIDHGVQYAQFRRIFQLVNVEFVMFLASVFLWHRIVALIDSLVISGRHAGKVLLFIFLLFTHAIWLHYYAMMHNEPRILALLSFISASIWLHTFVFSMLALTLEHLVRLFGLLHRATDGNWSRLVADRQLHTLMAICLAILFTVLGLMATNRSPTVTFVPVKMPDLDGFRLVLIADLHIGPMVGKTRVRKIVEMINSVDADAVAISGDLVDGPVQSLNSAVFPISQIKSKHGVFFATGNHEYYHGDVTKWLHYLADIGIRPLHNENVRIRVGTRHDRYLCLAGVDDAIADKTRIAGHGMDAKKALAGCALNDTTVLLVHQPNAAKQILDSPLGSTIDLVLSGHTHGGQMYILLPLVYLTNVYTYGLYRHENSGAQIYVSAGVNYWGPPVKMFGFCEIVLIQLERA